ncbi:MAG TPA: hypothetical protein VII45_03705 [Solirubrobacterales bacterium]
MREKLNSNPIAQVAIIGVLLVAVGIFLLGGMGGGSSEEEAAPTTETSTTEAVVAPAIGSEGVATPAAAPLAAPGAGSGIEAPPLPGPVQQAYDANETVVLLIVHNGGIDDRLVAKSVRALSGLGGVAVFVVPSQQISRYAAVTLGVNVDRVPALIVMRPKNLSDGAPEASVTYGYQSAQAIAQAVSDASYNGPEVTYHPN